MATADANGIAIIQDADNLSPLHPVFNLLGQSVSNAFDANTRIWPVANETARSAKVTEIGLANITGAKPLFVWRANAPAGRNLEFSTNGTVWNYYSSNLDTASQTLTLNSGFTSSDGLGLFRSGSTVFLEGTIRRTAGVYPTSFTTVSNIPVGWRPNGFRRLPSAGYGSASANGLWVNITSGGDLQVAGMGSSSDSAYLCYSWRLPV